MTKKVSPLQRDIIIGILAGVVGGFVLFLSQHISIILTKSSSIKDYILPMVVIIILVTWLFIWSVLNPINLSKKKPKK